LHTNLYVNIYIQIGVQIVTRICNLIFRNVSGRGGAATVHPLWNSFIHSYCCLS